MGSTKFMSPTRPSYSPSMLSSRFRLILAFCLGCMILFSLSARVGGTGIHLWRRHSVFPRKIWQSWKVDALRFERRDSERATTWTIKNPRWRYEVLTDDNAVTYVEEFYGPGGFNRPDIVSTYKGLKARIIQADLLRYLILYAEGGLWADIDVEAIRPIDSFIPKRYDENDLQMVIGIETDQPDFMDHPILGAKALSFCQWTFMTKPRLPAIMRLVENILAGLEQLQVEQDKPLSQLVLDFDKVLSLTGPSAFTEAIMDQMTKDTGKKVTWDDFHDLEESKVVGKVLILPAEAFAAGTGHSDSGNHNGRGAMVRHHFHASSWPSTHPRYKHPIFGEVEKCNWDPECVKLWDLNTAFFAALPEEEQLKMLAIKNLEDNPGASTEKHKAEIRSEETERQLEPPAGQPPSEPFAGDERRAEELVAGISDDAKQAMSDGLDKLMHAPDEPRDENAAES